MMFLLPSLVLTTAATVEPARPHFPLVGEPVHSELLGKSVYPDLLGEPSYTEPLALRPAPILGGSPFSYTYVEISATEFDVDDVNDEADIYALRGSLALGPVHLVASYQNQDIDFADTSADVFSVGAGLHFNLLGKLDIEGDVSWIYSDISSDLAVLDTSDSGYQVRFGPRWMALDFLGGLELNGELIYVDVENIASDEDAAGWGVGARLHFLKALSVGLNYRELEDDDALTLSGRISF